MDELQAGIKVSGVNISNLRCAVKPFLWQKVKNKLKSLFLRVKEESVKAGSKLNIRKIKIIASGPITSWCINEKAMKTVTGFIFLVSKINADSNCHLEIKRHFLLGRKVMTNLEGILKSRDITLSTKVHIFKAIAFPVVMCRCESLYIKKTEH